MFRLRFRPLLACVLGLSLGLAGAVRADVPSLESLARRIDALEQQNAELQEKVRRLESTQGPRPEVQVAQAPSGRADWAESTTVSSYGEVGYNRPSDAPEAATVDVQRAVIVLQHRFDDQTRMVGEWEWEHAVTSASDQGEAEVEQLWVEHEFDSGLRAKAGLFLMPFGLINQNHEPTAYYGVFRDQVERVIIPSTWREVGIGLSGTTEAALTWEVGLTTGFNLNKWDPASPEGRDEGPLQAIHGEGQFAAARDLSGYAALNWRGYPGLQLGAAVFTGKVGQQQPGFAGNDSRLVLADAHARYTVAGWDLSGVYARGTISRTEALNEGFLALAPSATPALVPSLFEGGFLQAAYKLWHNDRFALNPFLRYEQYNDAAAFGTLSAADGAIVMPDDRVWTLGASLYVTSGVVLKVDYQRNLAYSNKNGMNLGVGYSF
ncbi:MAG TPA: hypothetical protein VMT92_09955 [Steroidobacteraceae bacterium]|nr:hypothetical protein [Steroidobacteraceae bacterium]